MAVSSEEFKRSLSVWPSGVTVVTAAAQGVLQGMTVSAFGSVSLSPPLISVSLEQTARCLGACRHSGYFAINVLAADQQKLSNHFSSRREADRLDAQDYVLGMHGCPLLAGTVAHLECSVVATHTAGDHVLVIGQVEKAALFDRQPLLYCAGAYGRFDALG